MPAPSSPAPASGDTPQPPRHVAIIMDGNGRWAKARGLPRPEGHRKGAEAVKRTVEAAANQGIKYLTLYGFSSENWKRPGDEVGSLMSLLRLYLRSEIAELYRNGVRFRVIGERNRLDPDIVALIEDAESRTADNTGLTLILALSYGGRGELVRGMRQIAERVAEGSLAPAEIDERTVDAVLYTAGVPDPDLVIRTSGERRISNFLLWQSAYAELVFIDTLWPDFGADDLAGAVAEYARRERRFGTTGI